MSAGEVVAADSPAGGAVRRWLLRVVAAQDEVDAVRGEMFADRKRRVCFGLPFVEDEAFRALQAAAGDVAVIRLDAWWGRDVDYRLAAMAVGREQRAAAAAASIQQCRHCRRPAGLHCPGCAACWPDDACSPLCDAAEDDPGHLEAVLTAIERWERRCAS